LSKKLYAQLIFTSHDLSTMSSEMFRRDEIWFVAKGNEKGESIRKDAKFDKQYLEDKYGAVLDIKRDIN